MTLNELLQMVLPRYGAEVPKGKFLDAANAVQDVIAQRLWLLSSDLLRSSISGTIAAAANTYVLPSGTLGLAEWPWVTNSAIAPGREIAPLPPALRQTFTADAHPRYFEQRALTLTVYPGCLVETTVTVEVFARPTAFADLTAAIPWDGMFDQVFVEATPRFGITGGMITVTPEMEAFINQRVDLLIDHRPAKSIGWRHPA